MTRGRSIRRIRDAGIRAAVTAVLGGFAGCANPNDRASGYLADLEAGRWDDAVTSAARMASDDTERNEIIDALELGTVQRIAGRYAASDATLGRAWDAMKRTADPGSPTFVDTLAAVAVNERALDYLGTSYDRVMCATLRALDALASGDPDSARVELKRAQFAPEAAEARFAEQIEAARAQMEQEHDDLARIQEDPEFQSGFDAAYGDLEARFKPYAGWTIPFTDWLTAVLLHVDGSGSGDRNRSIDLLRRVRGTLGDNPAVDSDLSPGTGSDGRFATRVKRLSRRRDNRTRASRRRACSRSSSRAPRRSPAASPGVAARPRVAPARAPPRVPAPLT